MAQWHFVPAPRRRDFGLHAVEYPCTSTPPGEDGEHTKPTQMTERALPNWQTYERMIARMIADQVRTDLCVTPNARVVGRISGTSRQIDVLIESRHDTTSEIRVVVDAKRRKRKIGVQDVEALVG